MRLTLENLHLNPLIEPGDRLGRRLLDCWGDTSATAMDLAVLSRQWMRRKDIKSGGLVGNHSVSDEVADRIRLVAAECGIELHLGKSGQTITAVKPWAPDWVRGASESHPVDQSSGEEVRRKTGSIPADIHFQRLGHKTFKTNGQFAAVQAVRAMEEGSTAVVMLPTGSGKTEVALALIEDLHIGTNFRQSEIVSVIVVPYVALAKDLERRLQTIYKDKTYDPNQLPNFAYTHDMSTSRLESLLDRIERAEDDIPGILITSPESLVGRFKNSIESYARDGRLGAIIVDEAHLLYQSGIDFRLSFRDVPRLRDRACIESPAGLRPRTLLMSATIGDVELNYFEEQFGPISELGVIDATEMRQEPDIFVAYQSEGESRFQRLKEALSHLPRPALVYVTKPEIAKNLTKMISDWGYGRVRCVVGETTGPERARILEQIRTGDENSEVDVVVANAAFGLGIDCEEIRTVLHVCLPETVDRWYQEIGRGGRDGCRSVGLLLPDGLGAIGDSDLNVARSMSPMTLRPETLRDRWEAMKCTKRVETQGHDYWLINLRTQNGATDPDRCEGKVHSHDTKWNRTILYAFEKYGFCNLRQPLDSEWNQIREKSDHWDWLAFRTLKGVILDEEFNEFWEHFREKTSAPFAEQLEVMTAVAKGLKSPCEAISETYEFSESIIQKYKPSIRVNRCENQCGHCGACFQNKIMNQQVATSMPRMSVKFNHEKVQLVRQLQAFWEKIPSWSRLRSYSVNILPVFVGNINSVELSKKLDSYAANNRGWIYKESIGINPSDIWKNSVHSQVPTWSVADSPNGSSVIRGNNRPAFLYRKDLGVPSLVVLVSDVDPKFHIENPVNIDSLLGWEEPEEANWRELTSNIIRGVLMIETGGPT